MVHMNFFGLLEVEYQLPQYDYLVMEHTTSVRNDVIFVLL